MNKIKSFVNLYPLSKTLRFSLMPIGRTEENFENAMLLETDKKRAEAYERVKGYIDRYHKCFMENVISKVYFDNIRPYAELYYKTVKTDKEKENMVQEEAKMRRIISDAFKKHELYKSVFGKEMIEKNPSFFFDR